MELAAIPESLEVWGALAWGWTLTFLPRLAAAALTLVVGAFAAGWASRAARRLAERSPRIDPTFRPVIGTTVHYAVLIFVIVAALAQLGVQTASVLAVLGAAGLAIGLALQGTLANIAAGMMLLWLRPFRIGDYIETTEVAGIVEELDLFNTQLRTWDGLYKFVPNSKLWNAILTNHSRNPTRLIHLRFPVSYETDVGAARAILLAVANAHPNVLADPAPSVAPVELAASAIPLELRAWTRADVFWDTRWDLTEEGKARLEAAGFALAYEPRVVSATADRAGRERPSPRADAAEPSG